MEKKEKKADLEQLLNSLIEKGWKPRGKENAKIFYVKEDLRELVSKESWLWQFVCENGMVKSETWVWVNAVDGMYKEILINQYNYRYWIIESALKDESELEDFLLQNIKVDE